MSEETRTNRVTAAATLGTFLATAKPSQHEINDVLLNNLATKPHPSETVQDTRVAHHLLDIARVTKAADGRSDLDVRMYLALRLILEQAEVLDRLRGRHDRERAPGGMVGSNCVECGTRWPCDTLRILNGELDD